MTATTVTRFILHAKRTPGKGISANYVSAEGDTIECVALRPATDDPLPVCLFLFGGGGHANDLVTIQPLLDEAFASGAVAPMTVACAGVPPFCFYLDEGEREWETTVAERLLEEVRARSPAGEAAGLVGISMGGYGALKIAFARPDVFGAVAAVAPMIEPSTCANGTPLRNRFHYPPEVPDALLGERRDARLYRTDHPACRARARASRLSALAIRIDAGSRDAVHAHDGAEHLHRLLWDLDVPHDYHLLRDADHVGPSIPARLVAAFAFVGRYLTKAAPAAASYDEVALRDALAPAKARAAERDPTVSRIYGDPASWT